MSIPPKPSKRPPPERVSDARRVKPGKRATRSSPPPAAEPPPPAPAVSAADRRTIFDRAVAASRREALREWRRVDLEPWEKEWANRTRAAGTVVTGVLQKLRLDQRKTETEIVKVWNRLLDPNVAAHAQPVGLRNGTLFVNVDSSVWLSEIVRYRQQEILMRLQSSFGSELIKRLSIRIG